MIYSIKFVFTDGKDLIVNVMEAKVGEFFNALSTKTVFFDAENNVGFWTDMDKVRFVELRKIPVEGAQNAEPKTEDVPPAVPQEVAESA